MLNKLQVPECVKDPSHKELQGKAGTRKDKKIFLKRKQSKKQKKERERKEKVAIKLFDSGLATFPLHIGVGIPSSVTHQAFLFFELQPFLLMSMSHDLLRR